MRRNGSHDLICAIAVGIVLVATGCQPEATKTTTAPQPPSSDQAAAEPASEASAPAAQPDDTKQEITLEVVDKDGLQKAIDKHRGKVVLVDVWATWCAPCKKMFPHTVELYNKHRDQGLAVVSLSMDEADAHEDALAFLKQQKATFTNLRSKFGAEEQAIEAFDIDGGALPHFKLYDRSGKPVKKLVSGDANPPPEAEDIDKAVEELLSEKP
jgi:thiol-disulfide isomerase/thioredoxin